MATEGKTEIYENTQNDSYVLRVASCSTSDRDDALFRLSGSQPARQQERVFQIFGETHYQRLGA
jgi:hypothetical protein